MLERSLRIFVVDDEPIVSWTIGMILEAKGFLAQTFTDPHEALKAAGRQVPDLLLSDVMMPSMSGVELAIQITAIRPACKVLLFSGKVAAQDLLRQARQSGHTFELLTKPIQPNAVLAAIESMFPGAGSA